MKLRTALGTKIGVIGVLLLSVLVLGALRASPAHAETFVFPISMNAAQAGSTCPGGSPGTGSGTVTYDDVTNTLSWNITFSGLSGAVTAAHFHGPALPGQDAGIQVTITDTTSPSIGSTSISAMQETQLLTSMWYVNFHTAMCSGGEIRGQVSGAGVGGIASAPDVERSSLAREDKSGSSAGPIAAITAAIALAAAVGGATFVWARRRVER